MTGVAFGVLVAVLVATSGLAVAATLRMKSVSELVLAAYVVGFGEIVALVLLLSLFGSVHRAALLAGLALTWVASIGAWVLRSRPLPQGAGLRRLAGVVRRDPVLAPLAVLLAIALAYSAALIVGTPPNNGDSLAYHLARSALWLQEGRVGHVSDAYDQRLNVFPPNGEIVLTLMLEVTRSERMLGFVQFAAAAACAVGVFAIARRLRLPEREAAFGALIFLTLPIVVLQASTTQNDLVVASLLVAATVFLLGDSRTHSGLAALAVALAFGTKILAVFALPLLVLVALSSRPRTPRLIAIATGSAIGSYWYVLNRLDSGLVLGEIPEQSSTVFHAQENALTALAFLLDTFDLSGAVGADLFVYVFVGTMFVVSALVARHRGAAVLSTMLLSSGLLVAIVPLGVLVSSNAVWHLFKLLNDVLSVPAGRYPVSNWPPPTKASESFSWFGPLGLALVVGVGVAAVVLARRRTLPPLAFILALAPLVWLVMLSLSVPYDKSEGRYFLFPVALSAALWGMVLRVPPLAWATGAVAATTVALSLVHFVEKPSGLRLLEDDVPATVWGAERWEVQSVHDPKTPASVLRFLDNLPRRDTVALALGYNDFGYAAFGPKLERHVELVPAGSDARSSQSDWLLANRRRAREIDLACWQVVMESAQGWIGLRRLGSGPFADPCR